MTHNVMVGLLARWSECFNVYFDIGNEILVPIWLEIYVSHATFNLT